MNATTVKELLAFPLFRLTGYRPKRVSAETWDQQYRSGQWDYLNRLDNLGGLVTVFGYCQYLAPKTILDVGCGEGLLAAKLKVLPYQHFVGIDISSEATAKAEKFRGDTRTKFVVCDADKFLPDIRFDVIIFNQCLYYMPDPVSTMRHYARFLTSFGRMIVSLYDAARSRATWSLILGHVDVEDSMTVIQSTGRTTTKVVRPK
jgi:2-polyprenyl-3-methyl-5-hydroxy-6-metoxy-1,4-benzoquinol methylase